MNYFERKAFTFLLDSIASLAFGLLAFYLAVWVAPGTAVALAVQLPWLYLAGGILFSIAVLNDCYSIESIEKREKFFIRWLVAWLIASATYFLIFVVLSRESQALKPGFVVPRLVPGAFLLVILPGIPLARILYDRLFHFALGPMPALLIGKPESCQYFLQEIQQTGFRNWEFVGQVDPASGRITGLVELKETEIQLAELSRFTARIGVVEIILTDPHGLSSTALTGLINCFEKGVEILSLEQAFEKTMSKIPVEHLGEGWLPTTFWSHVQVPLFYRAFKRTLDVCGGGILLVGTLPLMILAAFSIKITSPGPVFYKQHRVGLHGRRFVIRKLRTMNDQSANSEQRWAEKNDPRITPLGRILRKLRIDELPQLLNVIAGQMSLVGPRPEQPEIAAKLEKEIPFFRARGKVLPGITGWAQVKYRYGNSVDDSRIKLEYDLYYIKNRSILLDLIILAKTVRIVLGFKGH